MIYNLEIYFMVFMIYSILGWLMECTLGIIENHKFVNRGFLIGPYCPIYGVGVVCVSLLLSRFANNFIVLFLLSTILCGALEYFTSYIMEKFFNARWWDYSKNKFNINGRVCLETLIPFGVISFLIISFANPWLFEKLYSIDNVVLNYLVIILLLIYITDLCISFTIILRFKNLNKAEKDNTEEISKKVRETAEAAIKKLTDEKEVLLRKMNIRRYVISKNIKYTRKKYTSELKDRELTLLGNFKVYIENINKQIKNIDEKSKELVKDLSEKLKEIKENQLKIKKDIKDKFSKESKLNKRLISAFPNVEQREYTRKKKNKK